MRSVFMRIRVSHSSGTSSHFLLPGLQAEFGEFDAFDRASGQATALAPFFTRLGGYGSARGQHHDFVI
jgi:hypothetical protein